MLTTSIFTNRIFFYQKSDRDHLEPRVAALLKPQTVAHEGAHQILSNIGVQPRPNSWPPWLVEGLAEYCATTVNTKKGIMWSGLGAINSLHMATIRELEDPLSNQMNASATSTKKIARKLSISQSEALLLKQSLTPTDYAEAWALTHYLAQNAAHRILQLRQGDEPGPTSRATYPGRKPSRVPQVLQRSSRPARQEAR